MGIGKRGTEEGEAASPLRFSLSQAKLAGVGASTGSPRGL